MPSDERDDALASAAGAASDPFSMLRAFRAIVWATFDDFGRLTASNAGFDALATRRGGGPDPAGAARVFVDPKVGELLALTADAQGVVYRGLLTVVGTNDRHLSLRGAAARREGALIVLAEHAIEETQEALEAVLKLNEELADTQRELVVARRRLEAREEALRTLAATDTLTGLPNRRTFLDLLDATVQRVARGQRAALLMLDVDDFKQVNDRLGHATGDAHLRAVAHAMRSSVRAYDLPARLAGDEFAVLLPDASLTDATEVAGRLLANALTPHGADVPNGVPLSIGVIVLRDGEPADEAMKRVDLALYSAKDAGRGRVVTADD